MPNDSTTEVALDVPAPVSAELASIETDAHKLPSSAAALHESIRYEGIKELERESLSLVLSALAAGLSMGASMIAKAFFIDHIPQGPAQFLVANLGYTVGFVLVILAKQQLFTENTVTAVLPFMSHPTLRNAARLLRLWGLVLTGNLVGVALFAFTLVNLPAFDPKLTPVFLGLGHEIMQNSAMQMFCKGIFAGWLIATLVWMMPNMGKNRLWAIILVTYIIAIGEFTHIIVGSAEVLYLVFMNEISFSQFLFPFAIPTLIGNIIGGTFIFALISHAQIRSDMPGNKFE